MVLGYFVLLLTDEIHVVHVTRGQLVGLLELEMALPMALRTVPVVLFHRLHLIQ